MLKPLLHILSIVYCLFSIIYCQVVSAQTTPDTAAVVSADTLPKVPSPPATADSVEKFFDEPAPAKPEGNSIIVMSFVKEKEEHAPDSMFFNILKITNNNASPVQGVVRISVPGGWKIISEEETMVSISAGSTEYIPIRVSLDRKAIGGVSYLIHTTLYSNRSLFPDKNRNSISKSCYITIPHERKWDIHPVQRTMYFDRYSSHTPLKLKITNKGNGNEVVKLEFEIGSSLQMFGAFGNRHFTSIELKPHSDTILSFPIKYLPVDESDLWNRDFKKLNVRITATVDTFIKKTSVNFKYLESTYYNILRDKITPLNIDVQLQNLLSDASPRMLAGAYGTILLKNNDDINYDVRFYNITIGRYKNTADVGEKLWRHSRMSAGYTSEKWQVMVGDVYTYNSGFLSAGGRGIGGKYKLNFANTVGGVFTAAIGTPIYSGSVFHETMLLKRGSLRYSLNAIADNYNKLTTYGASAQSSYSFLLGHSISLLLAVATTQHNYNDSTFFDLSGNPILTTDPGVTRFGFASQIGYQLSRKKINAGLNVLWATRDYSQYYSGKLNLNANAQYLINKKYSLAGSSGLYLHDPRMYNRGVLYPQSKYFSGTHKVELARSMTNKLMFYTGPVLEHFSHSSLKIDPLTGDSTFARFKTISPKLSLRASYKNNVSGFINPYTMVGYTFVTLAEDSSITIPTLYTPKNVFFNIKVGLNVIQRNWGMNVYYYLGPQNMSSQSEYYYFGRYSKSLRIMPFFQKYYFDKKMLLSSYNSYYYEVLSNNERIALNLQLKFFLEHGWAFAVDNNLFLSSNINSEGQKVYSRNYFLNIGVKKSFDIPQPRIKYYDLKIICFKDLNGNKTMDENEHGLSDIVISVDRQPVKSDSITNKPIRQPGQFSPVEMVTDNFGQVLYYHIPEGEFNLGIFPLQNLKDIFILNGQKQSVTILRDTTYYIPFVQSYRVVGRVILNRDEYSSAGAVSVSNIRITATDSLGNSFPALTSADGSYTLYVPQSGEYKVNVNNVFGEQFILQESEYEVSFDGAKEFHVDFIFNEKKRKMNINSSSQPVNTSTTPTSSVTPLPANEGVTYRIQIGASSTKTPPSQYAAKFKGAQNIQEYVENGIYKYTAGDFNTMEEAQKTKEELGLKGYKGAFVVSFKDNKKVVNPSTPPANTTGVVKDTSSSANPLPASEGVIYRIQIGASSTKIPPSQYAAKFKGAQNIQEYVENGVYKYTTGEFQTWEFDKATDYKEQLKAQGYKDAFVAFFKEGKRVK